MDERPSNTKAMDALGILNFVSAVSPNSNTEIVGMSAHVMLNSLTTHYTSVGTRQTSDTITGVAVLLSTGLNWQESNANGAFSDIANIYYPSDSAGYIGNTQTTAKFSNTDYTIDSSISCSGSDITLWASVSPASPPTWHLYGAFIFLVFH